MKTLHCTAHIYNFSFFFKWPACTLHPKCRFQSVFARKISVPCNNTLWVLSVWNKCKFIVWNVWNALNLILWVSFSRRYGPLLIKTKFSDYYDKFVHELNGYVLWAMPWKNEGEWNVQKNTMHSWFQFNTPPQKKTTHWCDQQRSSTLAVVTRTYWEEKFPLWFRDGDFCCCCCCCYFTIPIFHCCLNLTFLLTMSKASVSKCTYRWMTDGDVSRTPVLLFPGFLVRVGLLLLLFFVTRSPPG